MPGREIIRGASPPEVGGGVCEGATGSAGWIQGQAAEIGAKAGLPGTPAETDPPRPAGQQSSPRAETQPRDPPLTPTLEHPRALA